MRADSRRQQSDRRGRTWWVLLVVAAVLVAPLVGIEPAAAATAPTITSSPQSKVLVTPGLTTLSSNATGDPVPTVQWERSTDGAATWEEIVGATAKSYVATVDASTDFHQYRAVYTNSEGSAVTSAATLSLGVAPTITLNPISMTVADGATVTFQSGGVGNPAPSVRWQSSTDGTNWTNISGSGTTSPSYTRVASWSASPLYLRARYSNTSATVYTAAAILTVNYAPRLQTQPVSKMHVEGSTFTLSATARAWPRPDAAWESSPDGGATWVAESSGPSGGTGTTATSSYSAAMTASNDGWQYRVRFTNESGSVESEPATMSIGELPVITANPLPVTAMAGDVVTFEVAFTGTAPATVEWRRIGNPGYTVIPSDGTGTLTYTATVGDHGSTIQAHITNPVGSASSVPVAFTVYAPPTIDTSPSSVSVQPNGGVSLKSRAKASPPPTAVWQRSLDAGATWADVYVDPVVDPINSGLTRQYETVYGFQAGPDPGSIRYRAVFTNVHGSATSAAATVRVLGKPKITSQPSTQLVAAGATATFTAGAQGYDSVRWQRLRAGCNNCWNDVVGATSPTYVLEATPENEFAALRAIFTNADGETTTRVVSLRIVGQGPRVFDEPPPSLTVDGEDVPTHSFCPSLPLTCPIGRSATFRADHGFSADSVRWQRSDDDGETWTNISGATSLGTNGISTYTRPLSTSVDDGSRYRAVFTNSQGTTASASTTLIVRYSPVITGEPSSVTVEEGSDASFTGAFVGNGSATWQMAAPGSSTFTDIEGSASTTLVISDVTAAESGRQFRMKVKNEIRLFEFLYSEPATLTVTPSAAAPVAEAPVSPGLVAPGTPVSVSFRATGVPAPSASIQISPDGVTWIDVGGSVVTEGDTTAVSIGFVAVLFADGWQMRGVFANEHGSDTSDPIVLEVGAAPVAEAPVPPAAVAVGMPVSVSFSATGVPAPSAFIQVSLDGVTWFDVPAPVVTVGDRTTVSLDFVAVPLADGLLMRGVFTNEHGSATSDAIVLQVDSAPVAEAPVQPAAVAAGTPVSVSFSATGDPTPSAFIQVSPDGVTWIDVGGSVVTVGDRTTVSLDFVAALFANGWQMRGVFTNEHGSTTSAPITLWVT